MAQDVGVGLIGQRAPATAIFDVLADTFSLTRMPNLSEIVLALS